MIERQYEDKKIREDIAQVRELWKKQRPGAAQALNRLKKKARELGDNELLGFVYFHFADLYYYREPDYDKFKKNISDAIRTLMQSEDKELLGRAYNFVGFDAANYGSYDVAFNYYNMCLKICQDMPDALVPGIAHANLGQLFNELGQYELARRHVRKGIRIIARHPEDGKYYRNLINMHFQDGMISLAMNRFEDVEKTLETIRRLMDKFVDADEGELEIPMAFIKVRVALVKGDLKEAELLMTDLLGAVSREHALYDCIDDLFTFLGYLIDNRHLKLADRLIKAIRDKVETSGITHIMTLFSELLVSYYDASGNSRLVTKELRKQHELNKRTRSEQRGIHVFSIDLIRTVSELQEKQEAIMRENAELQAQAYTDALTGIPNRHAMNRQLTLAYERSFREQKPLGVSLLDIDSFKEYNDAYGHQKGDDCLIVIADELKKLAQDPKVFCARYGGDEFIIIYEDMEDREMLTKAEELARGIAAHKIPHKNSSVSATVTISQGICYGTPQEENKFWDYLEVADKALYTVKNKRYKSEEDLGIRLQNARG